MSELISPRLRELQNQVENGDKAVLPEFWAEIEQRGTPIIENAGDDDYYVSFLWRDEGTVQAVDVIQDWGADGIREHHMTHLPGTDIWYKTRVMRSDTRTTYQLAPDPLPAEFAGGVPFILDPLNPNRTLMYFDETDFKIWFSPLVLPGASSQPWINAKVPKGTITLHTPFTDGRQIWVYLPPTDAATPYSLLLVFDGRIAKDLVGLPQMLDVRIAEGSIRPTVAVLVDNSDRRELTCDQAFTDYVTQRIVPWVQSKFPVSHDVAQTTVTGASYGGLCAAYLGLRHPEVFGRVLSQTGWFRWHPESDPEHEWLTREFSASPVKSVRFYLDVGLLENARMLDGGPSQLVVNRHMRDVLRAKGYEVIYREYSGGHDYSSIQNPLFDALPLILG